MRLVLFVTVAALASISNAVPTDRSEMRDRFSLVNLPSLSKLSGPQPQLSLLDHFVPPGGKSAIVRGRSRTRSRLRRDHRHASVPGHEHARIEYLERLERLHARQIGSAVGSLIAEIEGTPEESHSSTLSAETPTPSPAGESEQGEFQSFGEDDETSPPTPHYRVGFGGGHGASSVSVLDTGNVSSTSWTHEIGHGEYGTLSVPGVPLFGEMAGGDDRTGPLGLAMGDAGGREDRTAEPVPLKEIMAALEADGLRRKRGRGWRG